MDVARLIHRLPSLLIAVSRRATLRRVLPAGLARLDTRPKPRVAARPLYVTARLAALPSALAIPPSGAGEIPPLPLLAGEDGL